MCKKMKKTLIILSILISVNVYGAPNLHGKWKSSLVLSNEFNYANTKLDKNQKDFINQIFGKLIIIYKENTFKVIDKDKTIIVNGEKRNWEGNNKDYEYKIIASDNNKIIIKEKKNDNTSKLETLHFIGDDTYWIYLGSTKMFENLNIREYFVRVK